MLPLPDCSFLSSRLGQCFVEDCFKQAAAFCLAGGELRFKLVAERHQFVNFGYNSVLFGARWEGNG